MDDAHHIPADDPELAALLRFEPVPRKQSRAGGYRIAAEAVGLSANSAIDGSAQHLLRIRKMNQLRGVSYS
jgi:hypothetical protein